jgi:hypothetical protein
VEKVHHLDPPGRFLKKSECLDLEWFVIDDDKALKKTMRTFRELNAIPRQPLIAITPSIPIIQVTAIKIVQQAAAVKTKTKVP